MTLTVPAQETLSSAVNNPTDTATDIVPLSTFFFSPEEINRMRLVEAQTKRDDYYAGINDLLYSPELQDITIPKATIFVIDLLDKANEPLKAPTGEHTKRVQLLSSLVAQKVYSTLTLTELGLGAKYRRVTLLPDLKDIASPVAFHDWEKFRNEVYYRKFIAQLDGRLTPDKAQEYKKSLFFYHCTEGGKQLKALWDARKLPPELLERYQVATVMHHFIQEGYPTRENIIQHGGLRVSQFDTYARMLHVVSDPMISPEDWILLLIEEEKQIVEIAMEVLIINACDIADGITSGRGYDPSLNNQGWIELIGRVEQILDKKFPAFIVREVIEVLRNQENFCSFNERAKREYQVYRQKHFVSQPTDIRRQEVDVLEEEKQHHLRRKSIW